jgi:hypothetical protein
MSPCDQAFRSRACWDFEVLQLGFDGVVRCVTMYRITFEEEGGGVWCSEIW